MFKCGFEIECFIKNTNVSKFEASVKKLARIGYDASINAPKSCSEYELQTYPKSPAIAFKTLKTLLRVVALYGGTNSSCGLHFNFSTSTKKAKNFNPVDFCLNPIWERLLKKYRRFKNDFCIHKYKGAKFRQIEQLIENKKKKCYAVNLSYFYGKSNQRIEIRVFGNRDYHLKYQSLKKDCMAILAFFDKCSKS